MNPIERTLKYVNLYLTHDLNDIKDYKLPEGYKFVLFKDGDEKDWCEIEKSSGEFLSFEEAMESFDHYYKEHYDELKRMCLFIENDKGEKVATSTAFYLDEPEDDITGNVHWVSVKKEYQGKLKKFDKDTITINSQEQEYNINRKDIAHIKTIYNW